jgi:FMN phosphatase YigB (HAD superfamily)
MRNTPKTVIFDLDGTLALIEHRRRFITGKKKDWPGFFAACSDDLPNIPVIEAAHAHKSYGHRIVILSARSDEVRAQTLCWLEEHNVPYDELKMRSEGDFTVDEELKQQWLGELDRSDILCVYDDRDKVVRMWREAGIPCFQVAPGNF